MTEEPILNCPECGARLPEDLVNSLMEDHSVYCEQCGFENKASDFDIQKLKEYYKAKNAPDYKKVIKQTGKRLINMVKSKIRDVKE